jgi:hypothetical protein
MFVSPQSPVRLGLVLSDSKKEPLFNIADVPTR